MMYALSWSHFLSIIEHNLSHFDQMENIVLSNWSWPCSILDIKWSQIHIERLWNNESSLYMDLCTVRRCTHPTNDISIKFEIQGNFVMLSFITYSAHHNDSLHMSRQYDKFWSNWKFDGHPTSGKAYISSLCYTLWDTSIKRLDGFWSREDICL